MSLNAEQIALMVQQVGGIAAILNPTTGAAANALAQLLAQGILTMRHIEANSPEMWAEVSSDSKDAIAGFRAAVAAREAQGEG